jgi:DMSO/TMAO reductase YedYZ molybdopterin-dependent catalytic subunit
MAKRLTERKEAWAERMRGRGVPDGVPRSSDRLPPGQHLVEELPVLDLGVHPEVPLEEWRLVVDGEVEEPAVYDWPAFQALPRVESASDFHCVTTWSRFGCVWGGVRLVEVLGRVRPRANARFALFTSYDGYTTNLPLSDLSGGDALLADRLGGGPLPLAHGGPVRVVVPQRYAWKSAKFVRRIELRRHDEPGYWERRGYSNSADPWTEDRFARAET